MPRCMCAKLWLESNEPIAAEVIAAGVAAYETWENEQIFDEDGLVYDFPKRDLVISLLLSCNLAKDCDHS